MWCFLSIFNFRSFYMHVLYKCMPIFIFTWQLSVSNGVLVLQSCMQGIQEYFNETHRKQAAREERLGKQPCLLLTGPICPLHLEQHEKKRLWPNSSDSALLYTTQPNYFNINIEVFFLQAEVNPWEVTVGRFHPCFSPSILNFYLFIKSFESSKGSLWFTVVSFFAHRAKQELTGWKWIPCFQSKGCGILEQYGEGFFGVSVQETKHNPNYSKNVFTKECSVGKPHTL